MGKKITRLFAILTMFATMALTACGGDIEDMIDDALTRTATPVISPGANEISADKSVSITCSDSSATIYYTIDGTEPSTSSTKYTGPFKLEVGDCTVKAVAQGSYRLISYPAARVYSVVSGTVNPEVSANPGSGQYSSKQTVVLTSSNSDDDEIYYTLDGSNPDESSNRYSSAIEVEGSLVIKAFAKTTAGVSGDIVSFSYIVQEMEETAKPAISPRENEISVERNIEITCESESSVEIFYTLDGTTPTEESEKYTGPFTLEKGIKVLRAVAKAPGKEVSNSDSWVYNVKDVEEVKPVVSASPAAGTYSDSQYVVLSSNVSAEDTIYYTTDGTNPDEYSTEYSTPIEVSATMTIKAFAVSEEVKGDTSTFAYTINEIVVNPPVIQPSATDIKVTDQVSMTASMGTIYYTVNNSVVDATSTNEYTGPFTLAKGVQTVRAKAVYNGKVSTLTTKVYNVTEEIQTVSTPVIKAIGTQPYKEDSVFEVECSTSGASIQYKVDSGSYQSYSSGFTLSEGNHTIYAKATKSGMLDSNETSMNVEILGNSTGLRIYYKASSAPSIWLWIPGGTSISEDMGHSWPGPNMTADSTYPDWWYFEIPEEYGPFTESIHMKFKGGDPEVTLDPAAGKFWYDGTWHAACPDVAQTPVVSASPAEGTYRLAQSIELTSVNSDDSIYYTTDGNTPTEQSTKFSSNIPVSSSTIIKALGVNRDGVKSSIAVFSYVIDANFDDEKPTIIASVEPGNHENPVSVSFTIKDNKSAATTAYYTVNSDEPTTGSQIYFQGNASGAGQSGATFTVNMDETNIYRFLVIDGSGNETIATFKYRVGEIAERTDFREETIYFLFPTRFYDGDSSNNVHCWNDFSYYNHAEDEYSWKGDFKGLIEKLDYIKALGFSAIWITPPVKNASGYDYHGYHAVDFTEIDPRFDTVDPGNAEEEYQNLIDEIHSRGMKIIQDVVYNHTGNFGEENLYSLYEQDSDGYINLDNPDNMVANSLLNQAANSKYGQDYASLIPDNQYGSRIQAMKTDSIDSNHIYHHHESMNWDTYDSQIAQIAGDCVDLNTENPVVIDYLMNSYNKWINMGVDGFRVDTVKHVSRLMWNTYFVPEMKRTGGENFFVFGEVCSRDTNVWYRGTPALSTPFYTWKENKNYTTGTREQNEAAVLQNYNDNNNTDGQPTSDNHYLNGNDYHTPDWSMRSGMDVIDFPLHHNFKSASSAYYTVKGGDNLYNDATWNVTYVDSHDYGPNEIEEIRYDQGTEAWAENLALMFTWRGIPCIYYGSEIEFKKGEKIDGGKDRIAINSTGRAYFGDHLEGTVTATDFGEYTASGTVANTLSYPLAQHLIRLNKIRRAIPALQKGQYSTDNVTGNMAYKKRYTNSSEGIDSFVLVTVSGDATFTAIPDGKYVDAVTGDVKNVSGGSVSISCSGRGNLRVYVLDLPGNPAPGKIGETGDFLN